MINDIDEKIYFQPGNICTLKLDIPNKPIMMVVSIERSIIKDKNNHNALKGCKTRWFTENGFIQEAVFSTKDLILIKDE